MFEIIDSVTQWYMANINYWTIALLMTIESSFIPFPSEIVIPPAAHKAARGELNIFLVVVFGTIGAISGALFNYLLAITLGRAVLYRLADTRIAHALLVTREGIEKAEKYFTDHGNSSTFFGRLIPGIRQLISIPAGLARMNMRNFLLYTTLGAGLWNVILAILGYFLYSQKELLEKFYREISYAGLALGILFVAYLIFNGLKKPAVKKSEIRS